MALPKREFDYRAAQLQALNFQQTSRLVGFVEWLESDGEVATLLNELRAVDLARLLKDCGPQKAPEPNGAKIRAI